MAGAQPETGPRLAAFHRQTAGPRHHRGQRLRATHPAQSARQDPAPLERSAIMLPPRLDKGFIGALNDALRSDIDPRPGRHLAVHCQTLLIQIVEMIPRRPMRNEVRIRNQNARRIRMGAKHSHRPARLHQQRLIPVQIGQSGDNRIEILPGPRSPPDPSINHQFMRVLRHIGMQVVHQHPQRRLGQPAFGRQRRARGSKDVAAVVAAADDTGGGHVRTFLSARDWSASRISAKVSRNRAARTSSQRQGEISAI